MEETTTLNMTPNMTPVMTNYEMVKEFHTIFEHPINNIEQTNIFTENPKLVEFRLSQIEEELNELHDAVAKDDFIECLDAICDLMYFVYGTFLVFGINYDEYRKNNSFVVTDFCYPKNNLQVFNFYSSSLKLQIDLLTQYLSLLKLNCEEKDFDQTIVFLSKMEKHCYSLATLFGVDIDMCFKEVHRSNMTKVCKTEEEAKQTVDKYLEIYKNGDIKYAEPNYRNKEGYYVVYDKTTSKILKSINFELPNLHRIINLDNVKNTKDNKEDNLELNVLII